MRKCCPPPKLKVHPGILPLIFLISVSLVFVIPSSGFNSKTISLKKYGALSLPVPNPADISRLPKGKTFQIKHDKFILQFFFNYQDIMGVIVKRDLRYPIHLRWCFYRSCEENHLDFIVVIANPHQSPFDGEFFWLRFPPQIKYTFQGLDFSTGK